MVPELFTFPDFYRMQTVFLYFEHDLSQEVSAERIYLLLSSIALRNLSLSMLNAQVSGTSQEVSRKVFYRLLSSITLRTFIAFTPGLIFSSMYQNRTADIIYAVLVSLSAT